MLVSITLYAQVQGCTDGAVSTVTKKKKKKSELPKKKKKNIWTATVTDARMLNRTMKLLIFIFHIVNLSCNSQNFALEGKFII